MLRNYASTTGIGKKSDWWRWEEDLDFRRQTKGLGSSEQPNRYLVIFRLVNQDITFLWETSKVGGKQSCLFQSFWKLTPNQSPAFLSASSCHLRRSQLPTSTTQFLLSQGSDPGSQSSKQKNFPPKSFQYASLRKQRHTGWPSPEKQQTTVNRTINEWFLLCLLMQKKKNQKWICVHPLNRLLDADEREQKESQRIGLSLAGGGALRSITHTILQ